MGEGGITRLLGISGSLRAGSMNRRLLEVAGHELPPGVVLQAYRSLRWLPPYSEDIDDEPAPPAVADLRAAIAAADGVVIATPEYNRSLPGQLKNALDWASRPWGRHALAGKPVAVVGVSPSAGGAAAAQDDCRRVLAAIGAHVLDDGVVLAHAHQVFDGDQLTDPSIRARLASVLEGLIAVCDATKDHAHGQRPLVSSRRE